MAVNISISNKLTYVFVILGLILITSGIAVAWNSNNPPVMGHTANEIQGAVGSNINKISLDTPIIVWNTKSSIANGTIQAGVTSGLPSGAKSVLLYVSIDHNDGRSAGAYYKQPSQTTWKKLLYGNIYYPLANSVWLPLDSNGKLEWKIDSANQVELIEIQGYEI